MNRLGVAMGVAIAALTLAVGSPDAQSISPGTPAGGTATPCTTTGSSLQYNAAGAFGCVIDLTSNGTTLTALSSGFLIKGSSTGTTALASANAGASNFTLTLPAINDTVATLGTAQTFSAAQTLSVAGAASTPALYGTGVIFTGGSGTTTFPMWLIQPSTATASTAWSTSGTAFGINAHTGIGNIFDFQVDGVSDMSLAAGTGNLTIGSSVLTNGGNIQSGANIIVNQTNEVNWSGGRAHITSPAAANVQLGQANAASPVNQVFLTQGSRGGTDTNVAGATLTVQCGLGTGTGAISSTCLALQSAHVAASGTTQQTAVTQIAIGDNTVSMPNLASSSAATTGTVCWTTGGNLTVDTTLACLSSTRRVKHKIEDLDPVVEGIPTSALAEIKALRAVSYDLKPQFNPKHLGRQIGLVAEEVQDVDPRLVGFDATGQVAGVRYMQLTALLVKALQEEEAKNAALEKRVDALEHPFRHSTLSDDMAHCFMNPDGRHATCPADVVQ